MCGCVVKRIPVLATIALVVLAMHDPAAAADAVVASKAPAYSLPYDWAGLYVGGHVGYGPGHTRDTVWDPAPITGTNSFGGLMAGLHAGYNHVLPSRILLGVEGDITVPNFLDSSPLMASVPRPNGDLEQQLDYVGTVRGRAGYVFEPWMVYATGGFAFAGSRILNPLPAGDGEKALRVRPGWVAGGGAEYAFAPHWSLQFQYLYSRYGSAEAAFPSGTRYAATMDLHELRLGLNRKLDWADAGGPAGPQAITELPTWEMHGQTTYIQQAHPAFRSSYIGTNSLTPWPETRNTWSSSVFLGFRLWDGGALYYNPELLQGFGFNDTVGVAGFPNGEAQKSNFPYPRYSTSRLFLRHTYGLGGEQESLDSAPNQLAEKVDVSRLTVQVGRFAVADVFDGNAYAKDTRKDFMNWSIWASGAFDYAADKIGLGYGATAELNQKSWALRAGYFLMDKQSNSNDFDPKVFQRGEYVLELEERFSLFSRPGKLRTIAWLNSAFSGSYRETLDNPALDLDIAQTRRGRVKYGYVFNLEQSITDDLGVFGRWSWNDGRNEIMAFTDIDRSLSFGTSIKGTAWGRAKDTVGIGAAINGLSPDHRDFIAAGGLGPLIGDGQLNYRTERILETYYSVALFDVMSLTFDYQLIVNPAYNADRGPVSVFSSRLHAEF
ncbi:MAG TPA: carbohydrate porin [Xanthobacteraceae bacterium]|jgi:high affinity Mn2+ porin|nr:carbohydrate porin [Xanthobacteraceae bacterium]